MNKSIGFLLAGSLFFSCLTAAYAQSGECDQKLSEAETEFNAGHFYAIPSILQKCLEQGLSPEQSVRAYLILCQAYLIIDDPLAAEDNYLKLLKADPEFVPNDTDHSIEIVYLSKKFTATPVFTPHVRIGFSTSFYRTIYSVNTEPYGVPAENSLRVGFQFGGGVDWNVTDNISVCGELDFSLRGYSRSREGVSGGDIQSVISRQSWIDMPIYAKYTYVLNPKIRIFGYGGLALNYLLAANNEFTYTDNKPTGSQLVSTGPSVNVNFQLRNFSQSLLLGGGIKYKVGKDFFYADLRYMAGLTNLAVEEKLYYEDPSNISGSAIGNPNAYLASYITKYRYVSDMFRMDNLSLSFGFVHPIYNPRRVKKANTKKVARQIEKEEGGKKK